MESQKIRFVCQEVYRRYPEVRDIKPSIKANDNKTNKGLTAQTTYILTFTNSNVSDRKKSPVSVWVRVVVDQQGKIIKISSSH
jgi:hypothetical protein